jgi:ribosomal-protein-alanine N-acetyltransferase
MIFMFNIRTIELKDVDAIFAVELRSFPAPFSRDLFSAMFSRMPPFGGFVIELDGALIGYLVYMFIQDEMELMTVAVDAPFRGKGCAREMMKTMISVAKGQGVASIFLEVRPSNSPAQRLYGSLGFREISVRKKYYKDNDEDAIVMQLKI